ncbi:Ribonuclease H [Abeliophyllum distichum]|uniref:Ribonuclease H n=1 Tax=Abeliophyllum distichum TaxID=126358 RepID=A0ABD1Q1V4_9LAMI
MRELEWPQRMVAPPSKRDKRKYCHFHRDHGHDTENCFQLKEELERLLKRGFLARYMKNDRGKEMAVKSPTNPPPRAGVINVISGGIAAGGDSNSARKSYARSSGVLTDNGSAADVLTWDALLGLKAPLEKLRSVTTPLQGFGGATVIPEGTIELPVTLETYPASITIVTKFLVVKTHMA